MRVIITGGAGNVGTAVTKHLVKNGFEVRVLGIDVTSNLTDVDYVQCDIMHIAALSKHMAGFDAIVHLAAIPSPLPTTGEEVFKINVAGTFNVYEAAERLGIKRIVQASSINALGGFWGNQEHEPQYLPMDEAHPLFTTDPYSFSKEIVEDIADYYWRRSSITSLSYRLPAVWKVDYMQSNDFKDKNDKKLAAIVDFMSESEATRNERHSALKEAVSVYRKQLRFEFANFNNFDADGISSDPLWMPYAFDRLNYCAFITDEDSALAFECGLTADIEGSYPLFINHHKNWYNYDSQILVQALLPEVGQFTKEIQGTDTLVSINKARALINFQPEFEF